MANCIINGCENTISPRSHLKICALCRAGIGRWMKRRPKDIMERRRKLTMYNDRMANITTEKERRR